MVVAIYEWRGEKHVSVWMWHDKEEESDQSEKEVREEPSSKPVLSG